MMLPIFQHGSSLFRGSTACGKEYFKIFPFLNSYKYSSYQPYFHETDLIRYLENESYVLHSIAIKVVTYFLHFYVL